MEWNLSNGNFIGLAGRRIESKNGIGVPDVGKVDDTYNDENQRNGMLNPRTEDSVKRVRRILSQARANAL